MASTSAPRILTYKGGGAIAKGSAVKFDSADDQVIECTANTDAVVGIAQSALTAAEATQGIMVEVALPGGGAKGLAGETITRGKLLVPATDGDLEQTNTSGDSVCAVAMEDAVAGDIFAVEVIRAVATAADQ